MNKNFCKQLKAKGIKQVDILTFVNSKARTSGGKIMYASRLSYIVNGIMPPAAWELKVLRRFCKKHGVELDNA